VGEAVIGDGEKLLRVGDGTKLVRLLEASMRGINPPIAGGVMTMVSGETNG